MIWVFSIILCLVSVVQEAPQASAVRGITGRVRIETDLGVLRGRPDLDLDSPLLVRVAGVEPLGDGRTAYEVEFIGVNEGVFDLRDVLVLGDGLSAQSLDPIPIEILSKLGVDAPTDVFLASSPPTTIPGGYWLTILLLGIAWILIPLIVLWRRLQRHDPDPDELPYTPTLLDRLRPLIGAAAERRLSVSEQGQLELLLYAHWQEQLGLEEDRAAAIVHLRHHEVGGRLLRAVEEWLHAPRQIVPSHSEIEQLLEPYSKEIRRDEA